MVNNKRQTLPKLGTMLRDFFIISIIIDYDKIEKETVIIVTYTYKRYLQCSTEIVFFHVS